MPQCRLRWSPLVVVLVVPWAYPKGLGSSAVAAWRELEAERAQLQSQLQREQEELLARLKAEKEQLSEEIAALQQEHDEGLLLAKSEKQQVREPWRGLCCSLSCSSSGAGPCSATWQLGALGQATALLGASVSLPAGRED